MRGSMLYGVQYQAVAGETPMTNKAVVLAAFFERLLFVLPVNPKT